MRGFSLLADPRALLASFEAEREHRLQELARFREALPGELAWIHEARCVWLVGKLRIQDVPAMAPGAVVFDREALTVRYGGDFAGELLVGWIVGNLSTANFLGLWACR